MLPPRFGKKDPTVLEEEKRRRRNNKEAIMRGGVVSRPAAEVCHVFMAGHNYMPAMGMAGHSKWHNIRHKKGAEDAKRSIIDKHDARS